VPAAQSALTAVQSAALLLVLNWPPGQALHVRSALAEAAVATLVPASHTVTAAQAAASLVVLKVASTTQAAHWRSALALPTTDRPWPMAQVDQVAQVSVAVALEVTDLNLPLGHPAHTRSLLAVAAVVVL